MLVKRRKGVIKYDAPEFKGNNNTKKYAKMIEIWANLFSRLYQVKDLNNLLDNKTEELIFMKDVVQRQF